MAISQLDFNKWQPPPGFKAIESAVEGITVFAPREQVSNVHVPVTFNCPQCGATTSYDVSVEGVSCEHCGYIAQSNAKNVGRQADKNEFTLETLDKAHQGWGTIRKELHCDSCGANLTIPEGALTATCPFCASNKVNVRTSSSENLRPRYLIPFKILLQHTKTLAQEWLGKGWFHPKELSFHSVIDRFTGTYLSFWSFSSDVNSQWRAEVGYERSESYRENGEWKTRTVIDWRWQNGAANIHVDDLLISGNSHVSKIILERLYPFDFAALMEYAPDYLAGWQAQTYDVPLPNAWEEGKNIFREKAKEACYANIPTSHVRNFSMNADFDDETWRYVLLPVYLAAYKYEEKVFQVMINGQNGKVSGQKPVDWKKIWVVIAILLAPGLILGLIGLPLLLAGGVGILPIIIGFILLTIGGIVSFSIYRNAVESEAV